VRSVKYKSQRKGEVAKNVVGVEGRAVEPEPNDFGWLL